MGEQFKCKGFRASSMRFRVPGVTLDERYRNSMEAVKYEVSTTARVQGVGFHGP